MNPSNPTPPTKAPTGISGLDTILEGGFPRHWIYLVQGAPGTGKTTFGMQFLLEGARQGERVLYVTLSHTERELREIAHSHGWSLEGVTLYEFSAGEAANRLASDQTVFHTADVELGETMDTILAVVKEAQPERLVFDPVEQIRLLTESPLRYRRQILALKQTLTDLPCTSLFLTGPAEPGESELESLVHGIVALERWSPSYGGVRRQLEVVKGRGMQYQQGYHSFRINIGGLEVHPRLDTGGMDGHTGWKAMTSGVAELDALVGGGLEEGTACLVVGPTGTGKTSLVTLFTHSAAARGDPSAVFLFDERQETFYRRAEGLGMNIKPYIESGVMRLQQVNTGELSPGEFAHTVRQAVEDGGAKIVVIDSLTGYLNAMPQEALLVTQMHELLTYLSQRGVLTLLVMAQSGILGGDEIVPLDISYLADAVLLLRHFETEGRLRRAISVIKKRHGAHEATIRELRLSDNGIQVGEPLTAFRNILSATPTLGGGAVRWCQARTQTAVTQTTMIQTMDGNGPSDEARVLVLAPIGRDATLLCGVLGEAGLTCTSCQDPADLHHKLREGAGAVLLTEEALTEQAISVLCRVGDTQPAWSDLPVVVLVGTAWQGLEALGPEGNVTVLERPTRTPTLVSVMRAALRARRRQYQVRDLLAQQEGVNERLEERVQERTADLQISHDQTEAERRRISDILESITDGFIALDQDYRITYLNNRGKEILEQFMGEAVATIVGQNFWAVVSAKNTSFGKAYRRAMQERVTIHHEAFFEPFGSWFEVHAYPSVEGLSIYFRDIDARKKAEQTLRASEERFAKVFRAGPMAASLTTLGEGRFLDTNDSFAALTGYSHQETVGQSEHELGMWASREDRAKIKAALEAGSYRDLNLQIKTKAGDVRDILASAEVIEVAGTANLLHIFYDVTDRKRTEEELLEAIQTVMQDAAWFSHLVVERLAQVKTKRAGGTLKQAEVAELTPRERQVLERLAKGQTNEQIATDLHLAEQTVRNYITRTYEKLGVHSRTEAVIWARERGLVGS